MNSLELIDKREQLKKQAETLLEKAQSEQRKLNEDEQNEFVNIKKQIADTDAELRKIEEDNKKENRNVKSNKTMAKFSLLKSINDIVNNRSLDENSLEVVNAGIAEMRKAGQSYSGQIVLPTEYRSDIVAKIATQGQEVVAEDKLDILGPLRAKNVLLNAGATYMTGLVGDVSIPKYAGTTAAWADECVAAQDGAGAFSEVLLSPKRLTTYIDVSKQFLIQDSASAEELLRRDIIEAINSKLEATILGAAAGSNTQPAGLFNGATTATMTYAGIVGMEATLEGNNVYGDFKFIVSPSIKATLKTTSKDAGSGRFIMEGNEADGLEVLSTSNSAGIILGRWEDLVIGQWGGIDITVDPYSQAINGKVRLVVNAYFDAVARRSESFVAKTV